MSKALLAFLLLFVSSCSLLKLNIESDVTPLPKTDLNTRIAVRAFYNDFYSEMVTVADSIQYAAVGDTDVQRAAIQWKINTTNAAAKAAFQTVPEVSLVDTWILCGQMDSYFKHGKGREAYGEWAPLIEERVDHLTEEIELLAKALNTKKHYEQLAKFVNEYVEEHPVEHLEFPRENILKPLTGYLEIPDTSYVKTVGSGAEVMSDLTERIGAYNEQLQSQITWQKDLFTITWEQDSLSEKYLARADSLSRMLDNLATIAKESPEMLGVIAERMREELTPLVYDLNSGIYTSVTRVSQERDSLQLFLDEQRVLMVEDLNNSGQQLIETTTDNLIRLIKQVSWVLIILVVVLVVVFFGVPFAAGYFLAKARFKKKGE